MRTPKTRLAKKGAGGKDDPKARAAAAARKRQAFSGRSMQSGDQMSPEQNMVRMADTLSAFGMTSPAGPPPKPEKTPQPPTPTQLTAKSPDAKKEYVSVY